MRVPKAKQAQPKKDPMEMSLKERIQFNQKKGAAGQQSVFSGLSVPEAEALKKGASTKRPAAATKMFRPENEDY